MVKVILQAQYLDDDSTRQELISWGGIWEDQRDWLSYLALEMHRSGQNGAAISESRLREILKQKLTNENLEQFIRAVRSRGGLFEERAELFQFTHLTFQEFLAARLLTKEREKSLPNLETYIANPWWREVLLLVYGFAKQDYPPFATDYLHWLSTRDGDGTRRLSGLELAGSAVLEIERPDTELNLEQARWITQALTDPALNAPAVLRASAGNTLGFLGDPRFDKKHWILPTEDLFGFVQIPAGKFIMGSDDQKDDEKPQHEVDIPYDYYMARYPVTIAQYRAFVEQSGYQAKDNNSLDGTPNHPVVNVIWYDALEYCTWLTKQLGDVSREWLKHAKNAGQKAFWQGFAENKMRVILPSEAEWEKAARGTNGVVYPWGDKFDPNKLNSSESEIGSLSAVGIFPAGASPYGLLDMSGNVWEWTRSIFGQRDDKYNYNQYKYPYDGRWSRRLEQAKRFCAFSARRFLQLMHLTSPVVLAAAGTSLTQGSGLLVFA